MSQRTISLTIEDKDGDEEGGRSIHINADAVTYLQTRDASPTRVTYGFGVVVLLIGIYTGVTTVWWVGIATALLLGITLAIVIPRPSLNGKLGTLTRTHTFDRDTTEFVHAEFEAATPSYLTHTETRSGTFFERSDTYHFVPNNIDGLTVIRNRSLTGVFTIGAGVTLAAITLWLGPALADTLESIISQVTTAPSLPVVPVGIMLSVLVVAVGVGSLLEEPPARIRINFQTGASMGFSVSPETATELVKQFKRRGTGGSDRLFSVDDESTGWIPFVLDSRTHHFNPDNVALITQTDSRYRARTYLLVIIAAIAVTGLLTSVTSLPVALIGGLVTAGAVVISIGRSERATVRTVGGQYHFEADDMSTFADEFVETVDDCVRLDDTFTNPWRTVEYQHYVVPSNIVTLNRWDRWDGLLPLIAGVLAAGGVAVGGVLQPGAIPGPSFVGSIVIIIAAAVLAGGITAIIARLGPDKVSFGLRDGSRISYQLSEADATFVVDRFTENAKTVAASVPALGSFDRTRYVNAEAVTLVRLVARDRTWTAWLFMLGIPGMTVLGLWFAAQVVFRPGVTGVIGVGVPTGIEAVFSVIAVGVVIFVGLGYWTRGGDFTWMRTVTGSAHNLVVDSASDFRDRVADVCEDHITLEMESDQLLVTKESELFLIPDNVVSIETGEPEEDAGILQKLLVIIPFVITVGGSIYLALQIYEFFGVTVPVLLGGIAAVFVYLIVASGLMQFFLTETMPVTVEFVDGATRNYELTPDEADEIIRYFGHREPS